MIRSYCGRNENTITQPSLSIVFDSLSQPSDICSNAPVFGVHGERLFPSFERIIHMAVSQCSMTLFNPFRYRAWRRRRRRRRRRRLHRRLLLPPRLASEVCHRAIPRAYRSRKWLPQVFCEPYLRHPAGRNARDQFEIVKDSAGSRAFSTGGHVRTCLRFASLDSEPHHVNQCDAEVTPRTNLCSV
jgi:hypothetical protein